MKKHKKLRAIILWIVCFLLSVVIMSAIPGTSYINPETGTSTMHGVPALICFIVPTIISVVTVKREKAGKFMFKRKKIDIEPVSQDDVPEGLQISQIKEKIDSITLLLSRKKREDLAARLISDAKYNVDMANEDTSLSMFISHYDGAISCLTKLSQLEGKVRITGERPAYSVHRLQEEFQWHLCDAIERAKNDAISEIKVKYRNSIEYQKKAGKRLYV